MTSSNGQTYLNDMFDWSEETPDVQSLLDQSEITKFYNGCNVLITGGSGFLGKILVEKLLRSCSNIQKLYLIMRAKKGKSSEDRYKAHFEDPLYDRLKCEQPNFASKVIMVDGQMDKNGLGLSPENRELLKDSNIIFHGAATVRFDEKLRVATNINIRGTKEIFLFAREMPNLKAFVHIGTAYSQCVNTVIDEVFYPPPVDADKLLAIVDLLDDKQLELITSSLVGKWPNTYAFSKTAAENIILRYSTGIPTCIVRPSIMIATAYEPLVAWINNLYGPTGVVAGAGLGLLRTLHCDAKYVADIIPADFVINNIIVAAWDVAQTQKLDLARALASTPGTPSPGEEPPIYNSVSSCQNPITWGEFMKWNEVYGLETPSVKALGHYWFTLNKSLWVYTFKVIVLHFIPGALIDGVLLIMGRKPMLLSAYKKIHKFSDVIAYFSTQQWIFRNNNVLQLWDKVSPVDRKLFYFNMKDFDWENYFFFHIRGLRVFLIKDPMENLDAGRAKYYKLRCAHYTVLSLIVLLLTWIGFVFLRPILSILW